MKHTKLGLGLLAAAAAMMVMAFAASGASATVIEPAGKSITLKSSNSVFIFNNAFSQTYLSCPESETGFTVPEKGAHQLNENRTEVGTFSQSSGSVSTQLQQPTFVDTEAAECQVFEAPEKPAQRNPAVDEVKADVEVKQQAEPPKVSKEWTIAAISQQEQLQPVVAISVPQEALNVTITAGPFKCVLHVGPDDQQGLVLGLLQKENEKQVIEIDGQIQFSFQENQAICEAVFGIIPGEPAQFEATYVSQVIGEPEQELTITE